MNKDFPRIITLLRKEKKLSQKEAASQLGVSQALLSHYEKGIRECGLDFVCRAADLYEVSCDYLLGRTPHRYRDIGEMSEQQIREAPISSAHMINKRLITNALSVLYDRIYRSSSRKLNVSVSNYLMLGIYRIFRVLYSESGKKDDDLFSVKEKDYPHLTLACQQMMLRRIEEAAKDESGAPHNPSEELSAQKLSEDYPELAGSLFNVIQLAESKIHLLDQQL